MKDSEIVTYGLGGLLLLAVGWLVYSASKEATDTTTKKKSKGIVSTILGYVGAWADSKLPEELS